MDGATRAQVDDRTHATHIRAAADALNAVMWHAAEAGLRVEVDVRTDHILGREHERPTVRVLVSRAL